MIEHCLVPLLEALIFAAGRPVSVQDLATCLEITEAEVEDGVKDLQEYYDTSYRGIVLRRVSGGLQFFTRPQYASYVDSMLQTCVSWRLSSAALETLAIVAYSQPVTRSEIEAIRGVRADAVLTTLLDRQLIEDAGRRDTPGRPIMYRTTDVFLELIGLTDMNKLPQPKTVDLRYKPR